MKILKKIGDLYLKVIALSICYSSNEMNYKNKRKINENYEEIIKEILEFVQRSYGDVWRSNDHVKINLNFN